MRRRVTVPMKLAFAAGVVAGLAVAAYALPVRQWVHATTEWASELGPAGLIALIALHAFLTVFPIPNSWLQLAAGAMFGTGLGFVVGWIGAIVGGFLGVLLPRMLARDMITRWVRRRRRMARLDAAIQNSGWTLIVLCRLSPFVPYAGSNYVFGLSGLPLFRLTLVTALCIAPSTAMYAWFGAESTDEDAIGALSGLAVAAGVVVTIGAGIAARRLAEIGSEPGPSEPPGEDGRSGLVDLDSDSGLARLDDNAPE